MIANFSLRPLLGCALALFAAASPSAFAKDTFHGVEQGRGEPVVVFEAGHGDGQKVWRRVAREVSRSTRTFRYDRPGYGGTMATTDPRDPCSSARSLRAELGARGLKPPFILVGHSLGGLYQYAFAKLYPRDVAALVLVDTTHPDHWPAMQREAPDTARSIEKILPTLTPTERRELREMTECTGSFLDTPLDVPVRLLFRTQYDVSERGAFQRMIERLQRDWMRASSDIAAIHVEGAGHYVQRDRPEAVVAAIRTFLPPTAKGIRSGQPASER